MLGSDQTLLLRADAGPATGMKHVYRCVRLAKAWQKLGGNATLACGDLPRRLERQLSADRIRVWTLAHPDRAQQDARQTCEIARSVNPSWLVTDGPRFDSVYRSQLLGQRWKLAALDSPANGTDKLTDAEVVLLAGPRCHIPVTSDCQDAAHSAPPVTPGEAKKILVWLRESSSGSEIARTVENVIGVAKPGTSIDIVLHRSLVDHPEILALKKASPQVSLRFWRSPDRRLASMAPIHLAIVDEAGAAQHVASRGIPVAQIAQWGCKTDIAGPVAAGVMLLSSLRSHEVMFRRELSKLIRDRDHRRTLAMAGQATTDWQASHRVARRLASAAFRLDAATASDWPDLWRWIRNPESQSQTLSAIDDMPNAQEAKFLGSLQRPAATQWMLRRPSGVPVGAVLLRQEETMRGAIAEILIDPACRNQGFGTALLEQIIERAAADGAYERVVIQAKPCNQAAQRMAMNAGLSTVPPTVVAGQVALQFAIDFGDLPTAVAQPLKQSA